MKTIASLLWLAFPIVCFADEPLGRAAGDNTDFQFDGTWKPRSAMIGGVLLPPPALAGTTLTVQGDRYEVRVASEDSVDKGTVTRDESVTPHQMTIKGLEGPNKGKTILAIYEIKGPDAFRACYDLSGKAFPSNFKSPKGSQLYSVGYRRVQDDDSGWLTLLSAETRSLEEHWNTTGNWRLADGIATLTPRDGESGWTRWSSYLWSKKRYEGFDIQFEYKLEKNGNSGFYFRVGDTNDPVQQGIEIQIYDTDPKKDRRDLSDHDAGGIIPGVKPHRVLAKPAGQWNKLEVSHFDNKIVVRLNGETVNAHDLGPGGALAQRPRLGWIGFQDHGLPLSLRNIRIRTPSASSGTTNPN